MILIQIESFSIQIMNCYGGTDKWNRCNLIILAFILGILSAYLTNDTDTNRVYLYSNYEF